MNNNLNEAKQISFNIPKSVNFELLFNDFSPVYLPKIHFLVNQINFNTNNNRAYQLNTQNHKWFLGINGKDLTTIVNRLLDNDVIKRVGFAKKGKVSNAYQMVKLFDVKNIDESASISYPVAKHIFIQKWLIDGYVVKAKKFSAFQKENKSTAKEKLLMSKFEEAQQQIEALKARIRELEGEGYKDMSSIIKTQSEPLKQVIEKSKPVVLIEEKKETVLNNIISIPKHDFKLDKSEGEIIYTACGKQGVINMQPEFYNELKKYNETEISSFLIAFNLVTVSDIEYKTLRLHKVIEKDIVKISFKGLREVA